EAALGDGDVERLGRPRRRDGGIVPEAALAALAGVILLAARRANGGHDGTMARGEGRPSLKQRRAPAARRKEGNAGVRRVVGGRSETPGGGAPAPLRLLPPLGTGGRHPPASIVPLAGARSAVH